MYRFILFLIPFTISYAIISSVGTEGNHYRSPASVIMPDQSIPQPNAQ